MVAVVVSTLTLRDEPTVPSVVCVVFAAIGTYMNISKVNNCYSSTKCLEILVARIHRQVETFRACDEWGLCLQVLTELLVIKLYRGLRQVGKLVTRWGESHICLPVYRRGRGGSASYSASTFLTNSGFVDRKSVCRE